MHWVAKAALTAAILGGAGFLWITAPPAPIDDQVFQTAGDPVAGSRLFAIGGCASCHSAPNAQGDARLLLIGGRSFASPFGTFIAPNISPHPTQGIGGWTAADLARAMLQGVSPEGQHYYPSFPYTSFSRMTPTQVNDLHSYLVTLPESDVASQNHDLPLPFKFRRGLGLWKALYLKSGTVADVPTEASDGQFLVEGPGHCAECHTPRDIFGGLKHGEWLAGAPSPDGKGRIPGIGPGSADVGSWTEADIAYYLESGFTPDFDTAGGEMVEVIANTATLPEADRLAIARYLKTFERPD